MSKKTKSAMDAIERLVIIFKMERQIYLIITFLSFAIVIGAAIWLFYNNSDDNELILAAVALFMGSGGIIFSAGRLLVMFNKSIDLIRDSLKEKENYGKE